MKKTREQYKKWLEKNIEGWTNSENNKFINVIFKSGKAEELNLASFNKDNLSKFTKDELTLALLNKNY
ncbi:MAG: hypothetical protein ACRDD2_02310 [Sarcina sp.]